MAITSTQRKRSRTVHNKRCNDFEQVLRKQSYAAYCRPTRPLYRLSMNMQQGITHILPLPSLDVFHCASFPRGLGHERVGYIRCCWCCCCCYCYCCSLYYFCVCINLLRKPLLMRFQKATLLVVLLLLLLLLLLLVLLLRCINLLRKPLLMRFQKATLPPGVSHLGIQHNGSLPSERILTAARHTPRCITSEASDACYLV